MSKEQENLPIALVITLGAVTMMAACGEGSVDRPETVGEVPVAVEAPALKFTPDEAQPVRGKPSGPIGISYRVIGVPVVGQPVAVDLRVTSTFGAQPIRVNYRVNDATAMSLAQSQPARVTVAPAIGEEPTAQQVTVLPLREGRLYLNVEASVEGDDGSMMTVMAIPIQVGSTARPLEENGEVTTDENGELIRSLPAEESE